MFVIITYMDMDSSININLLCGEIMNTKKYVVQMFETIITECEVTASSEKEAKERFNNGDYIIINEYFFSGDTTWGELKEEEKRIDKKLH